MYTMEERNQFKNELKVRLCGWSVRLIKYLRSLSRNTKELFLSSIMDQLVRSGTSVAANYIEAIGSPSFQDFRKFISYSLKSANESVYWLTLIQNTDIDHSDEVVWLLKESREIASILGKSVSTMYKNV